MPGAEAGRILTCVDDSGKGQWLVPAPSGTLLPDGTDENDLVAWDDTAGEYVSRSFHQVLPGTAECDILKWNATSSQWEPSDALSIILTSGLNFTEAPDFIEKDLADADSYPRLASLNVKQFGTTMNENLSGLTVTLFQKRGASELSIDNTGPGPIVLGGVNGAVTWSVPVTALPHKTLGVGTIEHLDEFRATAQAPGKVTSPASPVPSLQIVRTGQATFDDYAWPQVGNTATSGVRSETILSSGDAEVSFEIVGDTTYLDQTSTGTTWSIGSHTILAAGNELNIIHRWEANCLSNSDTLNHTIVVTGDPAFDNGTDIHGGSQGPAVCDGSSVVVNGTTQTNPNDRITVDQTGSSTETDVVVASGGNWTTTLTSVDNGDVVTLVARGVTESDSDPVPFTVPAKTNGALVTTAVGGTTTISGTVTDANSLVEVVVTGGGVGTYTTVASGVSWSVTTTTPLDDTTVINTRAQKVSLPPLCPSIQVSLTLAQTVDLIMGDNTASVTTIEDVKDAFSFPLFNAIDGAPSLSRSRGDQGIGVQFTGTSATNLRCADTSVFDFDNKDFVVNFFTDFQIQAGRNVIGNLKSNDGGWLVQALGGAGVYRFAYYDGTSGPGFVEFRDFTPGTSPGEEMQITFVWEGTSLSCYKNKTFVSGLVVANRIDYTVPQDHVGYIAGGGGTTLEGNISRVHVQSFSGTFASQPELMDFTNSPLFKPLPKAGDTTIEGTIANEADGTMICVELNGSLYAAQTSVSGRRWSVSGAAVAEGNVITVIAQALSKQPTRTEFTVGSSPILVYEVDGNGASLINTGTAPAYNYTVDGTNSVVSNGLPTSSFLPGSTDIFEANENEGTNSAATPLLSGDLSFTFSCWFMTTGTPDDDFIMALGQASSPNEGQGHSIQFVSGQPRFQSRDGGIASVWPNVLVTNTWYHVAAVLEHVAVNENRYSLYINGIPAPVAYGTADAAYISNVFFDLKIVNGASDGAFYYDRVKIWNRAISMVELMEEVNGYDSSLIATTDLSLHDPVNEFLLNGAYTNTGSDTTGAITASGGAFAGSAPTGGTPAPSSTDYITGTTSTISVPNAALPLGRRSWAFSMFFDTVHTGVATNLFNDDSSVIEITRDSSGVTTLTYSSGTCTVTEAAAGWKHLACSYDYEYQTLTLWVNGAKDVDTGVAGAARTAAGTIDVCLSDSGQTANVDQVKFFQRPLTDGEVADLQALAASP